MINKSLGPDEIPDKLYKRFIDNLSLLLEKIFNNPVWYEIVPSFIYEATVIIDLISSRKSWSK